MRPEDNPADEAFERDLMLAEIATLARQLAEVKEENARVWAQLRAVDDTLNALGCSQTETFTRSAAIQRIADEREKWLTASRVLCAAHVGVPQQTCPVCQLAELDKEASIQRERANGLEYACEILEKQRDAMRGAISGLIETAAGVCRYDLHTPRMMALRAALKEARDVLAGRLGQHGRNSTDGDRREVGSGTTDEIPRIDSPVVAGEGCVGGPDGESGCVSLANGAVTPLDAMRGALESFASEKCRTRPGVTMEPKPPCESPLCVGCRARRALGAL